MKNHQIVEKVDLPFWLYDHQSNRNVPLDIVKGLLVILMIIYHCASMVLLNPAFQELAANITNRIDFIARAFLLLCGLLCGIHYLPQFRQSPQKTRIRLAIRGFKLLSIFLVLNLILYLVGFHSLNGLLNDFHKSQVINYFLYSFPWSHFSFGIIYFIGFFLLMTSLIIGRLDFIYPLIIIFLFNYNPGPLMWMTYGFTGIIIGSWNTNRLYYLWNCLVKLRGIPIILLFIVNFSLLDSWIWVVNCNIVIISTLAYCYKIAIYLLSLLFIVIICKKKWVISPIVLLGNYTLLAYLSQVFLIYANYNLLLKNIQYFYCYYLCNIVITSIILYLSIFYLDYYRKKNTSSMVNKVYKYIFN